MFRKFIVLLFLIAAVSSDSDCDNVKCDDAPKHYKELGCTPVKENNECCPSRYECPDKSNYALDKCYWQGKAFNISQQVPTEETNSLCSAGCFCAEGFPEGQPAEFRCAQIECGHFFDSELNKCSKQYTLGGCCPKYLCTEEEKKALGTATCEVDGKSYRVGESIYPKSESCYSCVCAENFDNSTIIGNPACKEINCGVELRNFAYIRNGCIPSFYGTTRCCPIGWKCPKDTDEMILSQSRSPHSDNPKAQCIFGKLTLHVGDEIKSDNECDVCKCVIPPIAHCVKKPNC